VISLNQMKECIELATNSFKLISSNNIHATDYGMLFENNLSYRATIEDNDIEITAGGGSANKSCIATTNNGVRWKISDNILRIEDGIFGLRSRNNRSHIVLNNLAKLSAQTLEYGYYSKGDLVPFFLCNTANSVSTTFDSKGFYTSFGTGYLMQCNEAIGGKKGFNFNSMNSGENRFKGNSCGTQHGVFVEDQAIMDVQDHQGNCWSEGEYAKNENSNFDFIEGSQFLVDDLENSCFLPTWSANGSSDWFLNLNDQTNSFGCQSTSNCPAGTGSSLDACQSVSYSDQIENALPWNDDAQQYYREFQILHALVESDCDSSLQVLDSFEQAEQGGLRYKIVNLEGDFLEMADSLDNNENQIQYWQIEKFVWIDSISVLVRDTANDHSDEIAEIQDSIDVLDGSIENLDSINAFLMNGFLTQKLNDLTSLTLTDTNDLRFRTVYVRYLESIQDQDVNWTTTEIQELEDIAYLCIDEGNHATIMSRSLLEMIGTFTFDEDSLCNTSSSLKLTQEKEKNLENISVVNNFQISPNPSSGVVRISMKNVTLTSSFKIRLLNVQNQLVLSDISNDENVYLLEKGNIPSGTYILTLTDDQGYQHSEKVIFYD